MTEMTARPGDPIYVPHSETAAAMSLGAVIVEGDARLHVPTILPEGISLENFARWLTEGARIVWIGEFLEKITGTQIDLLDVAGILTPGDGVEDLDNSRLVPLYVPSFEMDDARHIPGVIWDRRRKLYMADETADFGLIHRYLTPAMRAAWIADRNIEISMEALVRATAIISASDEGDERAAMQRDQDREWSGRRQDGDPF